MLTDVADWPCLLRTKPASGISLAFL